MCCFLLLPRGMCPCPLFSKIQLVQLLLGQERSYALTSAPPSKERSRTHDDVCTWKPIHITCSLIIEVYFV